MFNGISSLKSSFAAFAWKHVGGKLLHKVKLYRCSLFTAMKIFRNHPSEVGWGGVQGSGYNGDEDAGRSTLIQPSCTPLPPHTTLLW